VAQNTTFGKIQKISAAAILKVHKRVYLGQLLTDLHQTWSATSYWL